jgi:AcrR family transcriptional regulator
MEETVLCVREEGFDAASAKHIAERAGVTWGVIQYHFGDRAGLFSAVVESGFVELQARVADVDIPEGTIRDRIGALVDAAWVAFSAPTSMASLEILIGTRGRRDQQTEKQLAEMAGALARLGSRVISDRCVIDHPMVVGELLWATLRGLVLAQMVVSEPIDTSGPRARLVDVLVGYLSVDIPTA